MQREGSTASTAWSCSGSASMCCMIRGWPKRWCKRPSSSSADRPGTTTPTEARCGGWLFTMARSAAYDIARRPSSRPLLPVEDFQLPPQYDTVDQALTVLTVDQALDKLPSIYADVMRLVRDGFTHSEIAERLGIPIGTVKSRMAKAADTLRAELASVRGGDDAY